MARAKTDDAERYITVAGEQIEHPAPSPEVAQFLARVRDAVLDPSATELQLATLVLSVENPLVRAEPIWRVLADLVARRRAPAAEASERSMMTVAEAAAALDLTHDSVLKAIRAGKLLSEKRGGGWWVNRQSVATYRDRVVRRGRQRAPEGPALVARCGSSDGASLSIKAVDAVRTKGGRGVADIEVPSFERVAVSIVGTDRGRKHRRMLVLEPADESFSFEFHGFYVRGRARVARVVDDLAETARAWREFEPA